MTTKSPSSSAFWQVWEMVHRERRERAFKFGARLTARDQLRLQQSQDYWWQRLAGLETCRGIGAAALGQASPSDASAAGSAVFVVTGPDGPSVSSDSSRTLGSGVAVACFVHPSTEADLHSEVEAIVRGCQQPSSSERPLTPSMALAHYAAWGVACWGVGASSMAVLLVRKNKRSESLLAATDPVPPPLRSSVASWGTRWYPAAVMLSPQGTGSAFSPSCSRVMQRLLASAEWRTALNVIKWDWPVDAGESVPDPQPSTSRSAHSNLVSLFPVAVAAAAQSCDPDVAGRVVHAMTRLLAREEAETDGGPEAAASKRGGPAVHSTKVISWSGAALQSLPIVGHRVLRRRYCHLVDRLLPTSGESEFAAADSLKATAVKDNAPVRWIRHGLLLSLAAIGIELSLFSYVFQPAPVRVDPQSPTAQRRPTFLGGPCRNVSWAILSAEADQSPSHASAATVVATRSAPSTMVVDTVTDAAVLIESLAVAAVTLKAATLQRAVDAGAVQIASLHGADALSWEAAVDQLQSLLFPERSPWSHRHQYLYVAVEASTLGGHRHRSTSGSEPDEATRRMERLVERWLSGRPFTAEDGGGDSSAAVKLFAVSQEQEADSKSTTMPSRDSSPSNPMHVEKGNPAVWYLFSVNIAEILSQSVAARHTEASLMMLSRPDGDAHQPGNTSVETVLRLDAVGCAVLYKARGVRSCVTLWSSNSVAERELAVRHVEHRLLARRDTDPSAVQESLFASLSVHEQFGLVNRLDTGTSGLLLCAPPSPQADSSLRGLRAAVARAGQARSTADGRDATVVGVEKAYIALVLVLIRDRDERRAMKQRLSSGSALFGRVAPAALHSRGAAQFSFPWLHRQRDDEVGLDETDDSGINEEGAASLQWRSVYVDVELAEYFPGAVEMHGTTAPNCGVRFPSHPTGPQNTSPTQILGTSPTRVDVALLRVRLPATTLDDDASGSGGGVRHHIRLVLAQNALPILGDSSYDARAALLRHPTEGVVRRPIECDIPAPSSAADVATFPSTVTDNSPPGHFYLHAEGISLATRKGGGDGATNGQCRGQPPMETTAVRCGLPKDMDDIVRRLREEVSGRQGAAVPARAASHQPSSFL